MRLLTLCAVEFFFRLPAARAAPVGGQILERDAAEGERLGHEITFGETDWFDRYAHSDFPFED